MAQKRNPRKQTVSFDDRLEQAAVAARRAARRLPQGEARNTMLQKARQAEIARSINGWLASPAHAEVNPVDRRGSCLIQAVACSTCPRAGAVALSRGA